MTSRSRFGLAAALTAGLWAMALAGDSWGSVIAANSANGAQLYSDTTIGYIGAGSVLGTDFFHDFNSTTAIPPFPTAFAQTSRVVFPAAGAAKDKAQGTVRADFEFGAPLGSVTNDTLTLTANGILSAVAAFNSAGNPSKAQIVSKTGMQFFVDPFTAPPGTLIGYLDVPALRNLAPFETTLQIDFFQDGVVVGSVPAGSPATSFPLVVQHSYKAELNYGMTVPFGSDPPFSLGPLMLDVRPVPEPGSLILAAMGLVGAGIAARRRPTLGCRAN